MASGQEILDVLLENETRADLVSVFRKNPGLIDSIEAVARRIGRTAAAIQGDVAELVELGVLRTRRYGELEVLFLDRSKDKEIQNEVGKFLLHLKPNTAEKV